jgi:hypothetical protein
MRGGGLRIMSPCLGMPCIESTQTTPRRLQIRLYRFIVTPFALKLIAQPEPVCSMSRRRLAIRRRDSLGAYRRLACEMHTVDLRRNLASPRPLHAHRNHHQQAACHPITLTQVHR